MADDAEVQRLWREFWPQRGRAQCWDGMANLTTGAATKWVLIEAKASAPELLTSPCGASEKGGRQQIQSALEQVKRHLGVQPSVSWLDTYYQYANRLAARHFLNNIAHVPTQHSCAVSFPKLNKVEFEESCPVVLADGADVMLVLEGRIATTEVRAPYDFERQSPQTAQESRRPDHSAFSKPVG